MTLIAVSLKFLFKLILMIFVPVLFIVTIVWIKLSQYAKKNEYNINRNYYLNFYSYITSIVITIALLAINTSFSLYFTNILRTKDLIADNQVIYYCILCSPLISFAACVYYIVKLCRLIMKGKKLEKVSVEIL